MLSIPFKQQIIENKNQFRPSLTAKFGIKVSDTYVNAIESNIKNDFKNRMSIHDEEIIADLNFNNDNIDTLEFSNTHMFNKETE